MPIRVTFNGTAQQAAATLSRLPGILAGTAPDPQGIARGLQLRLGTALLSKVQQAFVTKARGGTGSDGIRWQPLKQETIDRRRVGKRKGGSVEILRDTGELFRSLSPGIDDRPSGAPGQVFDTPPGKVRVGTNKKPWHHRGVPGRLPARPLWPDVLPPAWTAALAKTAQRGVVRAIVVLLGGTP